MIEFTDNELGILNGIWSDWVQSSDYWTDEDQEEKSELFGKVQDEAKRRKLWWA